MKPARWPALAVAPRGTAIIRANRGRSLTSQYLLSGGLFQRDRCNANMIGFRTSSGEYYVCGSQPYRRGMGCGPGVYVPRQAVEAEVFQGVSELLNLCADPEGLTRQVNEELRRLWRESLRCTDSAQGRKEIATIEAKVANIRRAVEDGFADAEWANARLRKLTAQKETMTRNPVGPGLPQLDSKTVMMYRRHIGKLMESTEPAERKRLMRTWVQGVRLEPESLEVKITYRLPEGVMKGVVAGACYAAFQSVLAAHLVRRPLPRSGRRQNRK